MLSIKSILYLTGASPNAKTVDLVAFVFSSVFRIQLLKIPPVKSCKKLAVLMKFAFMSVELFFIMQISFFAKVVLFLTLCCISDLSIKNNILRKVMNRANRAKKI